MSAQFWMTNNMLKVNESKTEFIILGKLSNLKKVGHTSMMLNGSEINSTKTIVNLGVVFDEELSMSNQVSSPCQKMFYQIKMISFYRKFMTQEVAAHLMVSLVLSKID